MNIDRDDIGSAYETGHFYGFKRVGPLTAWWTRP